MIRFLRSVFRCRLHDEDGMAIITALLVIVVATFLAATAMSLSVHNIDGSSLDRARTQAIHASEAGIDLTMQTISSVTQANLPCSLSGSTNTTPSATWAVSVTYYATFPPSGTALTCTAGTGPSATPLSAVVQSTGSMRVSGGYANRTMQAQLKLSSTFGLLTNAIFSNSTSSINNQVNVYGYLGEDADVYVNGNVDCPNQGTFHGSVYAQGTISISNSCYFSVDAWAGGAVTMANTATVNHDVKSGSSSLTMSNNSKVNRNAWVKTTCSGCTSARVAGTVTTGGTGPGTPPTQTYPTWNYDATKWATAGYTVVDTTCAAAPSWLTNSANNGTKAVLRISSGCTLTLSGVTVTRTADLAIFTNGPIVTGQNTTFQTGDSDYHIFYMISESGQTCTTNVSGAPGTIFMASSTGFVHLHFLVFAPCKVSFANNNSGSIGQIYGNPVSFASNLSYQYYPTEAVGMGTPTSFKSELSFEREIKG